MMEITTNAHNTKAAPGFFIKLLKSREMTLVFIVLGTFILLSLTMPAFLTFDNLRAVFTGMGYELLIASGMCLVLILAGIDLSVGSVLALTSVVIALILRNGAPVVFGVVVGLTLSCLLGLINGFGVAWLRIPPFIVTLGMLSIARGLATVLTSGYELTGLPDGYIAIGQAELFNIPLYLYVVFILLLVFDLLLRFWKPLHNAYYVGHNAEAAELSGIHAKLITMSGYAIISTLAGIAAIIISAKVRMGYAGFGQGTELTGIASAVIGGASFFGGYGTVLGACLGVVFLAIINNAFVLAGFNPNWQYVISGVTLVLFLAINAISRRHERE
jgi:ribose transport system permease protein